jgi:hypothetical protein
MKKIARDKRSSLSALGVSEEEEEESFQFSGAPL